MRAIEIALMFLALPVLSSAQQPSPAARQPQAASAKPAPHLPSAPANPVDRQQLHASAMNFVEASDARQRIAGSLDKLLEDGKQSMLRNNPGMDPQFGEEWLKRIRTRVNVDEFVESTAVVYEKYFTREELDELTHGQLAMKKGQIYTLPSQLAEKLKTNSAFIQRDINTATSLIGARLGKEVGEEVAKDHPEWVKPPAPAAAKTNARKK